MKAIELRIAEELAVSAGQVVAAVGLLDEGATVPFIARYRKEVTGSLDDGQLRQLEERLRYLRELEERRESILKSVADQGKLTDELSKDINSAETKHALEDIYLPYKPKRRTKGQIAKEAGLEPLADSLLSNPELDPEEEAKGYFNEEHKIITEKDALDGAKFILMERFSEEASLLGRIRQFLNEHGTIASLMIEGKEQEGEKFKDYFEFEEPLAKIPSHRALALFRGRNEGVLQLKLGLKNYQPEVGISHPCEVHIANYFNIQSLGRQADAWLAEVVRWTWRVKISAHMESDLFAELRERAEADAIGVFANNLKDLLLAAPAGQKVTLGLDPGLRTGVKYAVIDATGKVIDHGAIFPHPPQKKVQESESIIAHLCQKHHVDLIAIGNGTASRETHQFVADMLKNHTSIKAQSLIISEAGASVYSASELAAKEFPELDVTIRGAISIARRLQDPLAELVKIDPKSIGVGQYQHDVSQVKLMRSLNATVEDCVNQVGVEVNTASAPLLAQVSGLNSTIANNIVAFRDQHGAFNNREQLKKVPRLGDKTWEQAIGFIRIAGSENPLDESAVHPESYSAVDHICQQAKLPITEVVGNATAIKSLSPENFVTNEIGLPTIVDIFSELEKPGRDPRPEFKTATLKEGIERIQDLRPNMVLEGTVTNVTNFGAFVDIGVHQDGLVHISCLTDRFVQDPRTVVKTGDIVKVKVLEVDAARKRIGLTMRMDQTAENVSSAPDSAQKRGQSPQKGRKMHSDKSPVAKQGSMGALLQAAIQKNQKNN